MGVILILSGMSMAERKILAVRDWTITKNAAKDVQCFLGYPNFYRRFIDHFSHVIAAITHLFQKKTPFNWSTEAEQALQHLERVCTSAPILSLPDPLRPYIVGADDSNVAIDAILSQRHLKGGQMHPIAFLSHTLYPAETN